MSSTPSTTARSALMDGRRHISFAHQAMLSFSIICVFATALLLSLFNQYKFKYTGYVYLQVHNKKGSDWKMDGDRKWSEKQWKLPGVLCQWLIFLKHIKGAVRFASKWFWKRIFKKCHVATARKNWFPQLCIFGLNYKVKSKGWPFSRLPEPGR